MLLTALLACESIFSNPSNHFVIVPQPASGGVINDSDNTNANDKLIPRTIVLDPTVLVNAKKLLSMVIITPF